jgi:hypothetical protein
MSITHCICQISSRCVASTTQIVITQSLEVGEVQRCVVVKDCLLESLRLEHDHAVKVADVCAIVRAVVAEAG